MSLPALHLRNQQAAVKMVETKGLSLRGGRRPTWQSREGTCSPYKPLLKWCAPIASVAALSERHWQLQISVYPADRTGHQICHCEEAVGRRGNLGKALPEWERHRRPYTPPGLTVAALSERHASWQSLRHAFCGARPSSLSLRGPKGAVAISGRQFRFRRWLSCDPAMTCEIATSACGLLAMTNLGASHR